MKAPGFKSILLAVALISGCENAHSKLDDVASIKPTAPAASQQAPSAAADHAGTVEERLTRLENNFAKYSEALDFLGKVYAQQKAQQQQQEREEHSPSAVFAVDVAADVAAGKVDGPADAYVTIVKAFDFACPYCQRTSETMDQLVQEYQGKVRVVYKDLVVHPDTATTAHLAACAGAKQGKYKAFKNAIWEKGFLPYAQKRDPSMLAEANLMTIAKEVGLDTAKLKTDMDGAECKALVQGDMAELQKFKVNGTPGFFINGKFIGGAMDKSGFKAVIDEKLKLAEASGVSGAEYYTKEIMGKGEKTFVSKVDKP
ncbi:MAG: thioredoxin domain-containing protein [Kofleriaceae bacterium]|nr:thioredoxin domain-containing protein [Kofleriaceae bacterium]